jgi:hypothetical protein
MLRQFTMRPRERRTVVPELVPKVSDPHTARQGVLTQTLDSMVRHPHYPFLGARSVFHRQRATFGIYRDLADPDMYGVAVLPALRAGQGQ